MSRVTMILTPLLSSSVTNAKQLTLP